MADDDWKDEVKEGLDKAKEEETISEEDYKTIKDALDAADKTKDFIGADDVLDILKRLAKRQTVGVAAAGSIVTILVTILSEGPCLWTGVIAKMLQKKKMKALIDGDEREYKRIDRIWRRFVSAFNRCMREANKQPKNVNHATPEDFMAAGLDSEVAHTLVAAARVEYFETADAALCLPGMDQNSVDRLIMNGFFFGIDELLHSGAAELVL